MSRKGAHANAGRASPVLSDNVYEIPESRAGRRQIPGGRAGPAFKEGIQEEDEEEEER